MYQNHVGIETWNVFIFLSFAACWQLELQCDTTKSKRPSCHIIADFGMITLWKYPWHDLSLAKMWIFHDFWRSISELLNQVADGHGFLWIFEQVSYRKYHQISAQSNHLIEHCIITINHYHGNLLKSIIMFLVNILSDLMVLDSFFHKPWAQSANFWIIQKLLWNNFLLICWNLGTFSIVAETIYAILIYMLKGKNDDSIGIA